MQMSVKPSDSPKQPPPDLSGQQAQPAGVRQAAEQCSASGLPHSLPTQGEGKNLVDVIAAVITDPSGRVLLARRTEGRDLAGLWEFPGGKREPDETAEAALIRELREELGIVAQVGAPLISVPQEYPDKRLRLDVRHVVSWQGTPRGLEGQALAWVPMGKLTSYAMPPADGPVVAALLQPDRYLVTPAPDADDTSWLHALENTLQRNADAGRAMRLQLRAPGLEAARWHRLATQAVAMCRQAGVETLLNTDAALAQELGTGLHLQARQLHDTALLESIGQSREGLPLGASCHNQGDLRAAQAMGCDFAVLGPVMPTPTHPDASGLGWSGFAALREHVSLPIYAIGGLGPDDIDTARAHGAQGIAAIRGLWAIAQ